MSTARTGCAFVPLTPDSHPHLVHLIGHRHKADRAAYCGVPLVEMTRDELLAFAAMMAEEHMNEMERLGVVVREQRP